MAKQKRVGAGWTALRITGTFFKWFFIVLGTMILIGLVSFGFLANYGANYVRDVIDPQVEELSGTMNLLAYDPQLSSTIYYYDKESASYQELETLYAGENRVWITYDQIPENLINATVAIEDKRFWTHSGVDWRRTLGAVYYMLTGTSQQGGSTITQQLIKNLTQNTDVTVKRKVLEIFAALEFDKTHTKEETLELYLNNIYLGRTCYGVYTASYKYFGKDVTELSLAECAALISITNNPSLYDPYNHPENNLKRRTDVLDQMLEQEMISQEEHDAAVAEEIVFTDGSLLADDGLTSKDEYYSWYTDAVIESVLDDLMEQYGYTEEAASNILYCGGLSIYTCLDMDVQEKVDAVYENPEALAGYTSDSGQEMQSTISIVDNSTGAVVALSGGIGEKEGNRVWNGATDTTRQPGSSIKPISVYAPALEEGVITPYTAIDDSPFMLNGDSPWPKNSSRTYSGLTSVYTGVLKSLNTVAVKTLDLVGVDTSFHYLRDIFGISSLVEYQEINGKVYSDVDYAPLALGGLTQGISTFEMAGAYSTFPRGGIHTDPYLYTSVTDSDGNVILSNDAQGTSTISEDTAYYMNNLLQGVVSGGTGTAARISGMSAAGKTGTTTNNYDRWFCGYTPYYTAAVWVGYERSEAIHASGNPATKLWQQVMSSIHEGLEDPGFFTPSKNVVSVSYCSKSGMLATEACSAAGCASTGYFLEGDAPTTYCEIHQMAVVCSESPIGDSGMYYLAGDNCPEECRTEIPVLNYTRTDAAASVTVEDSYQLLSWLEAQGQCPLHTEEWLEQHELLSVQSITVTPAYSKTVGDPAFRLDATSFDGAGNPGGTLSYVSNNNAVVTVDASGTVTVVGAGTAVITVTAAETEYAQSVSATVTITVANAAIDPQPPVSPDIHPDDEDERD